MYIKTHPHTFSQIIRFQWFLLFSHPIMSDSLWPYGLQHTRLPCPSPSPGACSNSYPLSRWCHLTISSSVVPFSCLQSFPALGSFQMSQLFAVGGQRIGVSASASYTKYPENVKTLTDPFVNCTFTFYFKLWFSSI